MQKEARISAKQAIFLVITCILTTVDVFLPSQVAMLAGRDAWISALLAPLLGYLIYRILVALCLLFPHQSMAGFNGKILGKYLGGFLTLIYVAAFLLFCTGAVVEFSIIISTSFKPESPPYLWHLTLLLPSLLVATMGISVPARMNEILLPLGVLLLVLVSLMNISNIQLDEFLPIFQYGPLPFLEGAGLVGGRLSYALLLVALAPLIKHQHKLPGFGAPAFVVVGVALLFGTLSIPIIGLQATQAEMFPALMLIRAIDIGFLTRMDPFIMMIWFTGFFVFLAVFSYGAAVLTRDLFRLQTYRWVLWFYGLLIVLGANFRITNVPMIRELLGTPASIGLYLLALVIPLFLYIVARTRGLAPETPENG